eukprot:2215802-Ditylum_brightwellii.AAC.1
MDPIETWPKDIGEVDNSSAPKMSQAIILIWHLCRGGGLQKDMRGRWTGDRVSISIPLIVIVPSVDIIG